MAATSRSDYIARIRYLNSLPPPPNPPKLLNIPIPGLASGQYTSPAFASRLAREQPLNIEADAELGMPIDLIGIPGVFEGNENAIYALDNPPPVHPHDKPLLRPLSMLGKSSSMAAGVSFLRRTEYIASEQRSVEGGKGRDLRLKQDARKRKRPEAELENDPVRILRAVERGFDIANPGDASNGGANLRSVPASDIEAWEKPRHPKRPDLTVLDTYPILPDLDAFPDTGFYLITKFTTNPARNADEYDPRIDVGLLRPLEPEPEVLAKYEAEREASKKDPTIPAPAAVKYNYEFFLPSERNNLQAIKTRFNVSSAQKDDPTLYDNENKETGKRFFKYQLQRTYETYQAHGDTEDYYNDTIGIALHDGNEANTQDQPSRLQKGAYFYPIMQRTTIRPRRSAQRGLPMTAQMQQEDEEHIDFLEVVVREPNENEAGQRLFHKENALGEVVAE